MRSERLDFVALGADQWSPTTCAYELLNFRADQTGARFLARHNMTRAEMYADPAAVVKTAKREARRTRNKCVWGFKLFPGQAASVAQVVHAVDKCIIYRRANTTAQCAPRLWEPTRDPCPRSIDHVPHLPSMREAHSSSRAPHTPPPPPPRDTDLSLKTAERSGCWATNPAAQREHAECQQPRQTELGDDWPAFEEDVERWCACAIMRLACHSHMPWRCMLHAARRPAMPCHAVPCMRSARAWCVTLHTLERAAPPCLAGTVRVPRRAGRRASRRCM